MAVHLTNNHRVCSLTDDMAANISSGASDFPASITVQEIIADAYTLSPSLSLQNLQKFQEEDPHISSLRSILSRKDQPEPSDMKSIPTLVRWMRTDWKPGKNENKSSIAYI